MTSLLRIAAFAAVCALIPFAPSCASTQPAPKSAAEVAGPDSLEPGRYALGVLGMSCPKCISNVDLQLARIDGVSNIAVDMKNGVVRLEVAAGKPVAKSALFAAVNDAGFTLASIRKADAP
jgi:mercuric ion binding protein